MTDQQKQAIINNLDGIIEMLNIYDDFNLILRSIELNVATREHIEAAVDNYAEVILTELYGLKNDLKKEWLPKE